MKPRTEAKEEKQQSAFASSRGHGANAPDGSEQDADLGDGCRKICFCLNHKNICWTPLIFAILTRLSILMPTNALLLSLCALVATSKKSSNACSVSGKSFEPAMHALPIAAPDHHVSVGEATAGGWSTFEPSPVPPVRFPLSPDHRLPVGDATAGDWRTLKLSPVPHVRFALSPDHHLSVGEDTTAGWSTLKLSPARAHCSLCQLAMPQQVAGEL
jgi:hypothetical protein